MALVSELVRDFGGVTLIVLMISSACGYAISQIDFVGRKILWFAILASFIIPVQA